MRELIAGGVAVATAFIAASIAFQIVKPGSQAPGEITTLGQTTTSLAADLYS
jgi:hypothetical protein